MVEDIYEELINIKPLEKCIKISNIRKKLYDH